MGLQEMLNEVSDETAKVTRIKTSERICSQCEFWCGRCLKREVNRVANSIACEKSKPREGV